MVITEQKNSTVKNKSQVYELMFIKMTWIFLAAGFGYFLLNELVFNVDLVKSTDSNMIVSLKWKLAFCLLVVIMHFLKSVLYNRGFFENKYNYFANRIVWLVIISFAIIFINIGVWVYVVILFSILVTSLSKGSKPGLLLVMCSFIIHSCMFHIAYSSKLRGLGLLSLNAMENISILIFL